MGKIVEHIILCGVGSGVHHISFPGIPPRFWANRTWNFPSRTKARNFPGVGSRTGSGIGPGNPVPVPDFNIVSCFFNSLIKNKGVYCLGPIVNIACWVLIASEIFVVVFFSKIYFHLTNLKELIVCWVF